MANDLANLLGDGPGIKAVREANAAIVVSREGETVLLKIGNVEPIRLKYQTAIADGQRIMMASRLQPTVGIRLGNMRQVLHFQAAAALKIGHWLQAKGMEAKFLASDTKRILVER
jgi:hypothetical protein